MQQIQTTDPEIARLIGEEETRQANKLRMIASENYVSKAVLEATGSVLTNKYSEGYSGKRYYEGQQVIDQIETIAIERAKELFKAEHANVQPYSGSPANLAVYLAFMKPGETFLGMELAHGGHLTHGAKVSISGKFFNACSYSLEKGSDKLSYDLIRKTAVEVKPKIIIAGHSAYPGIMDFKRFREIADEVGAILWVDMAHFAGLVAAGVHPNPVPYADVVTTTTHKSLRGPRGAMILCKKEHATAIDKAVFPGLQGGPHDHTTAAIAVALKEAASDSFKAYGRQIVANASTLGKELVARNFRLVTGGTENHLMLIDLGNRGIGGKAAAQALDRAGIVLNANAIPFDTRKPMDPGGIRLGTPALTSRGMKEEQMKIVAQLIDAVITAPDDEGVCKKSLESVAQLCKEFPAPGMEQLS